MRIREAIHSLVTEVVKTGLEVDAKIKQAAERANFWLTQIPLLFSVSSV